MYLYIVRSTVLTQAGATNYTCRTPVGVVGQISPWNLPIYLLSFKIAPALAAGCTVVCKPSEMTSLTAYMLAKVMSEVGKLFQISNMYYNLFTFTMTSKLGCDDFICTIIMYNV